MTTAAAARSACGKLDGEQPGVRELARAEAARGEDDDQPDRPGDAGGARDEQRVVPARDGRLHEHRGREVADEGRRARCPSRATPGPVQARAAAAPGAARPAGSERGDEQRPTAGLPAEGERGAAERERGAQRRRRSPPRRSRPGRRPCRRRARRATSAPRSRPAGSAAPACGTTCPCPRAPPPGGEDRPAAREQHPPHERGGERRDEQPPRQRARTARSARRRRASPTTRTTASTNRATRSAGEERLRGARAPSGPLMRRRRSRAQVDDDHAGVAQPVEDVVALLALARHALAHRDRSLHDPVALRRARR